MTPVGPDETNTGNERDGVRWSPQGWWEAWLDGRVVASGPDKPIIEAAYEFHRGADEYRSGPSA